MSDSIIEKIIPDNAKNIVVFVHGFGVRWDSRGMFTEIRDSLPANWGFVLFDLYEVKGNDVYVRSVADQIERLKDMVTKVQIENSNATIHIIAHSKGCIVTALAKPEISGEMILLAPPESIGEKFKTFFKSVPGSKTTDDKLIVPRKDGTITNIPLDYFKESQGIDAEGVMHELSKKHPFTIVQTLNDEVIGETSYRQLQNNQNINIKRLNADHNFSHESRGELINLIKDILK